MDRSDDGGAMCLPPQLDKHAQETISHMLEPCSCQDYWELKLEEAVDSQRQLQNQVHVLLRRLEEADVKCAKSREEAALNAQALRRQIGETQRLAAECKTLAQDCEALTQECTRLESECNLYHNDREIFMEAADEAEERAAQAEDRAIEADRRVEELLQELEYIRGSTPQKNPLSSESLEKEEVTALRLKLAELETQLERLQNVSEDVGSCAATESDRGYELMREQNSKLEILLSEANQRYESKAYDLMRAQNSKLETLLSEANQRYEETLTELKRVQEACMAMESTNRDEKAVSAMVSSAISAGVYKALEQDRDEAISSLNVQFKAILKRMQGEFRSSRERLLRKWTEGEGGRERMKVAEKGMKSLLLEAHALRQEVALYKSNLDKAQEQIQLLAEENRELRLILSVKCNSCLGYTTSPLVSRGNYLMTNGKLEDELAEDENEDSEVGAARSPLTPLRMRLPHPGSHG